MGSSYDTQQQEICHPMGRLSLTGSCLRKNTGVVVGCAPRTVGIPTHIMNLANRNTTRNPAPLPHRAPNSCCPVGSHMACELRWGNLGWGAVSAVDVHVWYAHAEWDLRQATILP